MTARKKRPGPRRPRDPGFYLVKVHGELVRGWQRLRWDGREWWRPGEHLHPADIVAFAGPA